MVRKLGFLWLASTVLLAAACGESAKIKDAADAPARRVLLQHLSERVILPTYQSFAKEAANLELKTKAYAKSLSDVDRDAARAAWKSAMNVWEHAELMQVGPAAKQAAGNKGGMNLRLEIYSVENAYLCRIDQVLVAKQYAPLATLNANTYANAQDMAAEEYLLFDESTTSACPATDEIVKSGAWQKLVTGDIKQRRADYAATAAEGLHDKANQLVTAWQAFAPELIKAGAGSKLFATSSDGVNAVTNAMFYLDTETKDMKIANPAGLGMLCMDKPCPEKVEHPYAQVSKESIIANLEAFRDLFRGLPPTGADKTQMWGIRDLLHGVSQSQLANEMDGLLDNALAAANGIDITLEAALLAKDKRVPALYAKIQDLTARLKSDFIVQLHLSAPMNAAGDQD